MTIKSYIVDAYKSAFESNIITLETNNDFSRIVLDQTYFYPEGGGQPTDRGFIDQVEIIDVQIEGETIYHITNHSIDHLKIGQTVKCKINFDRRLSLMQQHTGQHILSSCAEKLFDANTVGFHIGEDYVTVDLDKKLSSADIEQLEKKSNDVVFSNLEVKAHYPSSDELVAMPLRKQPKVTENIRVIEVDGIDFSPCGGTHLNKTAEVGLIKIKRVDNYKTGVRIEFCCGYFALETFKKRNETINQLMRLFSVKDDEIVNFCEQILAHQKEDQLLIGTLKEQLYKLQVAQLIHLYEDSELDSDIKVITLIEEHTSMVDLRLKAAMIVEHDNFIVLAAAKENEKTHIVLTKSKNLQTEFDMGALFKSHVASQGIKGGGNSYVAQGGISTPINIEVIFEDVEKALQSLMEI